MAGIGGMELLILGVLCFLGVIIPAAAIIGVLAYMRSKQKP